MRMDDDELIAYLERDQVSSDTNKPVPRAALGRRASAALWSLRGIAIVVSAMVVYAFIYQVIA